MDTRDQKHYSNIAMSLQFNAALIKALHHSDKFSENYHLDINWQARWNFWNPRAFGSISSTYHGKSTDGCRVPASNGLGDTFSRPQYQ